VIGLVLAATLVAVGRFAWAVLKPGPGPGATPTTSATATGKSTTTSGGTTTTTPGTTSTSGGSIHLSFTSTGPNVGTLQQLLERAGYDPGPIDSSFRSRTRSALMRFEQDYRTTAGVAVDGEIDVGGPEWTALEHAPAGVVVPNVRNLDQVAAAAQLAAVHLGVKTGQEASDEVPAGKVIRTSPPSGKRVPPRSEVSLFVSSGPASFTLPSFDGDTEAEARNELQAAGFLQRVIYQDVPFGSTQDGRVISQNPAPGTELPKGETITLTVGKAVPPPTTTEAPTTTAATATSTSAP
jgi:peptidoglycan hydrolase-like protein with peptidoglycan-binding domain